MTTEMKLAIAEVKRKLAHDMRTPLSALDCMVGCLSLPAEKKMLLDRIVKNLFAMADDLSSSANLLEHGSSPILKALVIEPGTSVIVVDDTESVFMNWTTILDGLGAKDRGIQLSYLSSEERFRIWFKENGQNLEKVLFLFDFDLGKSAKKSGLEIVEEFGIQSNAILVTGYATDSEVIADCKRVGLRLIDKAKMMTIPVSFFGKEAIL